jgi:Protein of unknown function (DUF3631)
LPECGKTLNLEVADYLVQRPWDITFATPAAIFRKVHEEKPTILYDEIDTVFGANAAGREDLRGLLNVGFKRGASVPRVVGDGNRQRVENFSVFCAKAFTGIGNALPDTVLTRSIPIRMQAATEEERGQVEKLRWRVAEADLPPIRDRLAAWVKLVTEDLENMIPIPPDGLSARQEDIWEPLFAVADAAGGEWPQRARAAASALHSGRMSRETTGTLLLAHIRDAYDTMGRDRLSTHDLLDYLMARDDGPWPDWWAKAIDEREYKGPASRMAALLRPYGIQSTKLRPGPGDAPVQGYERSQFEDAWRRYCPAQVEEEPPTPEPPAEAVRQPRKRRYP